MAQYDWPGLKYLRFKENWEKLQLIKTMQTLIFDEMKEFQWKRDQLLASNATSKRLIKKADPPPRQKFTEFSHPV